MSRRTYLIRFIILAAGLLAAPAMIALIRHQEETELRYYIDLYRHTANSRQPR